MKMRCIYAYGWLIKGILINRVKLNSCLAEFILETEAVQIFETLSQEMRWTIFIAVITCLFMVWRPKEQVHKRPGYPGTLWIQYQETESSILHSGRGKTAANS